MEKLVNGKINPRLTDLIAKNNTATRISVSYLVSLAVTIRYMRYDSRCLLFLIQNSSEDCILVPTYAQLDGGALKDLEGVRDRVIFC